MSSFDIEKFMKKSKFQVLVEALSNNKKDILYLVVSVGAYVLSGNIQFEQSSINARNIVKIEEVLKLNIEEELILDIPNVYNEIISYMYQSGIWIYIVYSYMYNKLEDFKIRFWGMIALYFVVIFAFPCESYDDSEFIPHITNSHANALSITAGLGMLCMNYNNTSLKTIPYYALSVLCAIIEVMFTHTYIFSEIVTLMCSLAIILTKNPLTLVEDNFDMV